MSLFARFAAVNEADKSAAVKDLIAESTPDFDFFYLIVLSVLMASLGLLIDSEAVVIGSMLIAPILYPVISTGLGMAMSDPKLIARSLYTIVKASVLGAGIAFVTTIFFSPGVGEGITQAIAARAEPSLMYAFIAFAAGLAVSYSLVQKNLSASFPGIAVSVALIPPLAVVGIGIAKLDLELVTGSALLFLVNVVGILFACVSSFALMDVHGKRTVAAQTIEKEAKRVEREEEKVEKIHEEAKAEANGEAPKNSNPERS